MREHLSQRERERERARARALPLSSQQLLISTTAATLGEHISKMERERARIESERARESARERATLSRECLVLLSKSASDSTTVATCAIIFVNFPMRRIAASRAARHSTSVDLTRHCMCSQTNQSERESERESARERERERESEI